MLHHIEAWPAGAGAFSVHPDRGIQHAFDDDRTFFAKACKRFRYTPTAWGFPLIIERTVMPSERRIRQEFMIGREATTDFRQYPQRMAGTMKRQSPGSFGKRSTDIRQVRARVVRTAPETMSCWIHHLGGVSK
jgi:hypothetical protein